MITMAIKYVVIPEQKKVIAILPNTKYDAYNKAMKICRDAVEGTSRLYIAPNPDKLVMPNEFRGVAVCADDDVFDIETGKSIAKSKCLDKYYTSFDKRLNAFKEDLRTIGVRFVNTQMYYDQY